MKKILIVIPAMNIGGAEKSLVELSKIINYEKYSVELLLLEGKGVLLEDLDHRMKVIYADSICQSVLKGVSKSVRILLNKKKYFLALKRLFLTLEIKIRRKRNPTQSLWLKFENYIPKLQNEYDFAIAYLQGVSEYYVIDKVKSHQKILWMHTAFREYSKASSFESGYIKKYDKIVCVSEAAKKDFLKLFPEKESSSLVFYNLVNVKEIRALSKVENIELPEKSEFNIVSVGRLHKAKGYDLSIKAFSRLVSSKPNSRFYIIGDGPEKESLEKIIEEEKLKGKCFLLGAKKNPYVYMRMADVILQSSRYEGYCIVLSEAKALGKAIITTDFFGAREQIQNGENGMIIKCNEDDIYGGLLKFASSTEYKIKFEKKLKNIDSLNQCFDDVLM